MSDSLTAVSRPDDIAPHSAEAEEAVLGSILINPDAYFDVASFLRSSDFFIVRNAWIWDCLAALHESGRDIDNLTVINELRDYGQLDTIGGAAYITSLINNTPTHIHIETYGHIVERAAVRRRMLAAASEIAQSAMESDLPLEDLVNHAESTLYTVTGRQHGQDLRSMRQLASEYHSTIEYRYGHQDEPPGLPTGFNEIDTILNGLRKSKLIIIAGRPGSGKSAWMLNIAVNAAKMHGAKVGFFSLEMDQEELLERIYASETGLNSHRLQAGDLNDSEWGIFTEATARAGNWPLYIDDNAEIGITQLRSKCRQMQREHGLNLVVLDYVQLMLSEKREQNRVQELSYITRHLKLMSKELRVPVIIGSQLSRKLDSRPDKRPILSDLRESGSLEQDADIVMFIYRDEMYNDETERPGEADIIIAKHRGGPTATCGLYFNKALTQFSNKKMNTFNVLEISRGLSTG